MILLGAPAGGDPLQGGGGGPPAALGGFGFKGGALGGGFGAVNGALGRVLGFVPKNLVLGFFNAFSGVVFPPLPPNLFPGGDSLGANPAAQAFFPFKGVFAFLPGWGERWGFLGPFWPCGVFFGFKIFLLKFGPVGRASPGFLPPGFFPGGTPVFGGRSLFS
eukprot:UN4299